MKNIKLISLAIFAVFTLCACSGKLPKAESASQLAEIVLEQFKLGNYDKCQALILAESEINNFDSNVESIKSKDGIANYTIVDEYESFVGRGVKVNIEYNNSESSKIIIFSCQSPEDGWMLDYIKL